MKTIFRDSNNKVFAGVCSGIGNYFNIDPTLIRVLFVILLFYPPPIVMIYLLLWIVIPKS